MHGLSLFHSGVHTRGKILGKVQVVRLVCITIYYQITATVNDEFKVTDNTSILENYNIYQKTLKILKILNTINREDEIAPPRMQPERATRKQTNAEWDGDKVQLQLTVLYFLVSTEDCTPFDLFCFYINDGIIKIISSKISKHAKKKRAVRPIRIGVCTMQRCNFKKLNCF
jgi:hypothetical protein